MDVVFLIIGWLSIPVVLVGVYKMIASLKKEQTLRGRQLLIMAAVPVLILVLYEMLLDAESGPLSWLLLLVGVAGGGWVSSTVDLRITGNDVYGTRSYWYLVLWAATFCFAQLAALGALPAGVGTGLATMYFATGIAVGLNSGLWYRQTVFRNRAKDVGVAVTAICASCGMPGDPVTNRCTSCSMRLVPAATPAPPPGGEGSGHG